MAQRARLLSKDRALLESLIEEVGFDGLGGRERISMPPAVVVQDGDFVTPLQQVQRHVGAHVPGAAGHQDLHLCVLFSLWKGGADCISP